MNNILFLALGVLLLTIGGEALIRGAVAAANRLNVSPLLTGLIIVGFGTSAPELVVSVDAAMRAQPDLAIGNVVGSNIGNILLILGICALITPLSVRPLALRRDAITVVIASIAFTILSRDGTLGYLDDAVLLSAFAAYLAWAYWSERCHFDPSAELHEAEAKELTSLPRSPATTILAIVFGLLMLIGGARVLLIGAVGIAQAFGVSEAVIGLTIVAVGTSLPELSVSVIAAFRKHADVAVGNILGSNIFNLLGILGISALLQPLQIHERVFNFDQWVLLGTAVLILLFLYTGRRLTRLEGATLLAGYGLYLWVSFSVLGT